MKRIKDEMSTKTQESRRSKSERGGTTEECPVESLEVGR
jgi:hypothetical protein